MLNNKLLVLWGFIILGGLGTLVWSGFFRSDLDNSDVVLPTPTNTIPVTPSETAMPSSEPTSDLKKSPQVTPLVSVTVTPEPFLGLNGVKVPATCQVEGEVEFTAGDTFKSKGSKISWQNIDSRGRLIKWRISPDDKLAVGPNIFEILPLPDGQYENLTVRLPENPVSKNYLLTASVTYGQFIKGNLEVKEANCTGQVKVNLNFE